jgi:hypothetical protein
LSVSVRRPPLATFIAASSAAACNSADFVKLSIQERCQPALVNARATSVIAAHSASTISGSGKPLLAGR